MYLLVKNFSNKTLLLPDAIKNPVSGNCLPLEKQVLIHAQGLHELIRIPPHWEREPGNGLADLAGPVLPLPAKVCSTHGLFLHDIPHALHEQIRQVPVGFPWNIFPKFIAKQQGRK